MHSVRSLLSRHHFSNANAPHVPRLERRAHRVRQLPDAAHPAVLFFGDMDDSGRAHLIEAKCKDESMLPVRGRSCSSSAMPVIKRNFGTFRDFALADLPEIYSEERLDSALRLEAELLESGVWISSMRRITPSASLPNSYLVSTKINPCFPRVPGS